MHTEWLDKRTSVGRIACVLGHVCATRKLFSSRFYYLDVSMPVDDIIDEVCCLLEKQSRKSDIEQT